jgi:YhcH/YjgK/YiaL family protein
MILDRIENLSKYRCLFSNIDKIVAFYQECLAEKKESGQYKLDGDRLMANVDAVNAKTEAEAKLESHKKYIDIQVCLEGEETIGWNDLSKCNNPIGDFNENKDFVLYSDPVETWLKIPSGHFTVFYPEDGHAPLVGEGEFYKIVFKIAV